jgi:transposase-like protein
MQARIDDVNGFETVRNLRWPDGVQCPTCDRSEVTKQGRDETKPERQRYRGKSCERRFDDLTDTLFPVTITPFACRYCACISWASPCRITT